METLKLKEPVVKELQLMIEVVKSRLKTALLQFQSQTRVISLKIAAVIEVTPFHFVFSLGRQTSSKILWASRLNADKFFLQEGVIS